MELKPYFRYISFSNFTYSHIENVNQKNWDIISITKKIMKVTMRTYPKLVIMLWIFE